jgi:hypothetical protein
VAPASGAGRIDVLFGAAAVAPAVVWRVALTAWFGETTIESSEAGWKTVVPFYGMYSRYPFDWQHWVLIWTVYVPLLLVAAGALYLLVRRREVPLALLFLLNVALFVVFLPKNVTIDWGGAARNATPALLAALYLVPAVRNRAVLFAGSPFLSPLWYLVVTAALGHPGLRFMTT